MKRRGYKQLRVALFTNSYAGVFISERLQEKYLDNNGLKKRSRIEPEILHLARILKVDKFQLRKCLFSEECRRRLLKHLLKNDVDYQSSVKIFVEVEQEICSIKQRFLDTLLEVDEYELAYFEPALERVAGNHLCDIEDDNVFEMQLRLLKKRYRTWYYKTADKYKLPTPRILAFLLRIIS